MKKWYAKELSQLTNVSVRTLHHYDEIGLLKPSMRLENGYRLYSEENLLKLQQIIALKFFGFELEQIKLLVVGQDNIVDNFAMQSRFLQEKADSLQEASNILKDIITSCSDDKLIPWENILQLIEVYQMTKKLEHNWVKEIFTPDELKEYAEFETLMKESGSKTAFQESWRQLVCEIKANTQNSPDSKVGILLGNKLMEWVNSVYGKKYAHLRNKKWEQGFGEGRGLDEIGFTTEQMSWIEKAVDAYWKDRIIKFLNQIGDMSSSQSLKSWNEILDDMYGDDKITKDNREKMIIDKALKAKNISENAENWLKNIPKS
ncbi:MAG: MerR family transcriptional regulator [Legionellaceae bacterium]|nr:MerR family transcriptional regulator [Legionellaceae bacterium]